MASFVRSIQREETPRYVDQILGRYKHHIPLKIKPSRAIPGDFIYLAYRGEIIGRALISEIIPRSGLVPISSDQIPFDAKFLVCYQHGWQKPPRIISFKGTQGIRYVDQHGLEALDAEKW